MPDLGHEIFCQNNPPFGFEESQNIQIGWILFSQSLDLHLIQDSPMWLILAPGAQWDYPMGQ